MNNKCLIIAEPGVYLEIEPLLKPIYSIIHSENMNNAPSILRTNPISCIIFSIDGDYRTKENGVSHISFHFPTIPMIAILDDNNLELARFCGELGVGHVVSSSKLQDLKKVVQLAINRNSPAILLEDFNIVNINRFSENVKRALEIMEKQYLKIKKVEEIADYLEISKVTLSHEFKKYCHIGPKRLLMYFKIKHALHLMKNPGLNLTEISYLVGFNDLRRFNEFFHKILGYSPSECRKRV